MARKAGAVCALPGEGRAQYQSGDRNNPIMAGQAANLSAQDIEDLAAYYAQQSGLYTPKYEQQ